MRTDKINVLYIKTAFHTFHNLAKITHPSATRIRKVVPHPTESSWLISTSHGNNEVSIWNIETGHRQAALWASNAPPLSKEVSVCSKTEIFTAVNSDLIYIQSEISHILTEECVKRMWPGDMYCRSLASIVFGELGSANTLLGFEYAR